jgi:hypothetical protein
MDNKNKLLFEENFEYQTSEEVSFYPIFESMGLREELIRGSKTYPYKIKAFTLTVSINLQQFSRGQSFQSSNNGMSSSKVNLEPERLQFSALLPYQLSILPSESHR